ncbi:MAG: hypothetical protein M3O02_05515, partial [Acidobacteriota bacterium]|nr:hypothetical protein [Acidobacteriota bacterium]
PKGKAFDGVVYGFATIGDGVLAATSQGLLWGAANGRSWTTAPAAVRDEYHYVAAAKGNVVAASLSAVELSNDGGGSWRNVTVPPEVTQVTALAVDAQGGVWLGGRDGVFYTADAGASWKPMKDLYLRNPDCIFFDQAKNRMLVTSSGPGTAAFAVQLPSMQVTWWDTGWNLRFVRPIGDHLIAGTLFDGIVVQPRMVASPVPVATAGAR